MDCKSAPSVFCMYILSFYCVLVGSYHGSVLRQSRQRFRSNITSSELLCGITTMVLLTSLFIYKLTKVQRSITDATSGECKNLMSTVTKTFILTAASVISYILMDAAYIGQMTYGAEVVLWHCYWIIFCLCWILAPIFVDISWIFL
eukprot:899502_1